MQALLICKMLEKDFHFAEGSQPLINTEEEIHKKYRIFLVKRQSFFFFLPEQSQKPRSVS